MCNSVKGCKFVNSKLSMLDVLSTDLTDFFFTAYYDVNGKVCYFPFYFFFLLTFGLFFFL